MCKQIRFTVVGVMMLLVANSKCDYSCIENDYDFIVVGTGAAGGVILSRLSEDPKVKVLALEAGGDPPTGYEVPMLADLMLFTDVDWRYFAVPQRNCCRMFTNQEVAYGRGKVIGGSTTINFMAWTRGNKNDFDNWKIPDWRYKDVLPFFKKSEDYQAPLTRYDEKFHGKGGPITIEFPNFRTELAQAYQQGLTEMGFKETDYNAEYQEGFHIPPSNTRNHSRCGTYDGYIKPAMNRMNLRVESNALVTKILFNRRSPPKAIGVQYEKEGVVCEVKATKEVIVSGGTVNSPQLLMLSGIGPKSHLAEKGIRVVKDLPGVGQNLHDHLDCVLSFPIDLNASMNAERITSDDNNLVQYMEYRTGPYTVPVSNEVIAFVSTKLNPHKNKDWPDIELYFSSDHATRLLKQYLNPELEEVMPPNHLDYFTITVLLHHPKSRGSIHLNTSDPHDYPIIDPRFLTEENDLKVYAEGVRIAFNVVKTNALKRYGARIPEKMSPFCDSTTMHEQEYFECLIKTWTTTSWHSVGTCKMGKKYDKMAVVDNKLRVFGVDGLRVADASIIPTINTAHTNAISIMIGEKAAHIIKKQYKLK